MLLSSQNYSLYLPCSSVPSSKNPTHTIIKCQNPNEQHKHPIHRRHNSKSTEFLLQNLYQNESIVHHSPKELQDPTPHEEKVKLLELSLVRKRTPQFPGSIYVQSPSDPDVGSSLPPLQTLFRSSDEEEEEMIMRALEIRRNVTEEVFKEAMRKGKFGITYTENLVSRLGGFIDYVMVEAANLKRLTEYSNSTFNLRAKIVIDDSQVVPLIRYDYELRLVLVCFFLLFVSCSLVVCFIVSKNANICSTNLCSIIDVAPVEEVYGVRNA